MIEVETERLILKNLGNADKQRLVALTGDLKVSKTLSNVPYPYTDDDADYCLKMVSNSEFNLSIFLNNALIGGVGLTPKDDDFYELGYWLGVDYWEQGYGTEGVRGLLDYAETNTPHKRFKPNVYKGDVASAKGLEKVGFKRV